MPPKQPSALGRVWAVTGARPNPLAAMAEEAVCFPGKAASVQKAQLIAVHVVCEVFDACLLCT